ncbi:acetyl esterase [compost metagenome]
MVTECDPLHDDSIELERKLRDAGVDVASKVYPGTAHSFLEAVSIAAVAGEAFDDTARWLHAKA